MKTLSFLPLTITAGFAGALWIAAIGCGGPEQIGDEANYAAVTPSPSPSTVTFTFPSPSPCPSAAPSGVATSGAGLAAAADAPPVSCVCVNAPPVLVIQQPPPPPPPPVQICLPTPYSPGNCTVKNLPPVTVTCPKK